MLKDNENFLQNELPELRRLERRKSLMTIISKTPPVKGSEGMLLRDLSIRVKEEDPEVAYKLWTQTKVRGASELEVVTMPFEQFAPIHERAQEYLSTKGTEAALTEQIILFTSKDAPTGVGYDWNDKHERSQKRTRDLETLREVGVQIAIPSDKLDVLKSYTQDERTCPLIDTMKNERIARINGFDGSLMTLTIHDLYDHFYSYDLLEKKGIFARYKDFFAKVGNPHETDIFAREGELVASVVYNTRAWNFHEPGYEPTMNGSRIRRLLGKSKEVSPNQESAIKLLDNDILLDEEKNRRIGYITSRVLIQLMEQRRKQGFIRTLDGNRQPTGILPITDPEYISLLIQIAQEMDMPENNTRLALTNVPLLVEEYLQFMATNTRGERKKSPPANLKDRLINDSKSETTLLKLRIPDITDPTILNKTSLSSEDTLWILNNPGNSATQEFIC